MFRDDYIAAFSEYLLTKDPTKLLPYLKAGSNPAYLQIYRNGAIKSGVDALGANFPTVKQLLGDAVFNALARDYVLQQWPIDSSLATYGQTFAAFVSCQPPDIIPKNSADFAQLDRAWLDALFAKEDGVLAADAVLKLILDESSKAGRIALVNSVRLLDLKTKCLSEWLKLKFGDDADSLEADSSSVLIWRRDGLVYYRPLTQFERVFLTSIATSGSLTHSAEVALEAVPSGDISSLFAHLITAGMFVNVASAQETTTP